MEKLELQKIANEVRKDIVTAVHAAKAGHPGGSLSAADLFTYLYFEEMNVDPKDPKKADRDRFVLSKGHTAPGLYSVLAERGYFPKEDLKTLRHLGSYLQGHPDMKHIPGVDMSSGSLGQGISAAVGMALSAKLSNESYRVYTLLGDGEIQEGQVWEAAMFAGFRKLDNLVVVVDNKFLVRDKITLKVTGLGSSGEGVGKTDGFTVFAHGALADETVEVELEQVKKNYASGKVTAILEASPERVEPLCPVYEACGGCQLQHLNYTGQLKAKEQQVRDALFRIGHLQEVKVLPIIGEEDPWHYRNKMQFPVAFENGILEIGCYAAATHKVVGVENCLIQKQRNNDIIAVVRQWMRQYEISAYDEKTGKGVVRHVMGRVGVNTGEVMAVIITAGYDIPHGKELVKMLRDAVPGLKSVVQNINKKQTNIVMGNKTRLLYGKTTIKDRLGTLKFNISAQSFFQVNSAQAEKLYNKAIEFAALSGGETVVDCYCGTGTISLYLAKHAQKVYGIEIIASAIEDAKRNAEDNRCDNAEFILGDAAVKMQELVEQGVRPEVVLLDPPRAGCEEKVLAAIAQVMPQRIVYVSCNPASLARDLAYLEQNGYQAEVAQPVDMFPMTHHVETVVLMTRIKK